MANISSILNSQIDNIFNLKIIPSGALRAVNRALVITVLMLALYLMIDLILVRPKKDISALLGARVRSGDPAGADTLRPSGREYALYAREISAKNVFSGAGAQGSGAAVSSEGDTSVLLLIGVIGGEAPQAIIEDRAGQKTYYLKKGESFGDYTVEDISDGVVVLDTGGTKMRLKL